MSIVREFPSQAGVELAGDIPDKRGLALFDFDGTVTKRDSFLSFLLYSQPFWRFCCCALLLSPVIALYWLRILGNNPAKQMVLRVVFGGTPRKDYLRSARAFASDRLPALVRPEALERIEWHRRLGHRIVVVSASLEDYLLPWCEENGLELLATRLEVVGDKMTGRIIGRNCYGSEKVRRIQELLDTTAFDIRFAYGDSRGDVEMLRLADKPCYRRF